MSNSLPVSSLSPTSGGSSSSASQVQKALEKNWGACIELNYAVIGAHLVSSGHLSPAQHQEIESNSKDMKSRMEDLMTVLHELNSVEAFQAFKKGVVHCGGGESELAQRLDNESLAWLSMPTQPRQVPAPEAARKTQLSDLPPEVLTTILSYLPAEHLAQARLVSWLWNSIVIDSFGSKFQFQIAFNDDTTKVQDFTSTYSSSSFCAALRNFRFETQQFRPQDQILYEDFFHRFGLKIKALTLSERLCEAFVRFIFSEPIQPYLKNVEELKLLYTLPQELVRGLSSLDFLLNVKRLTIRASRPVLEHGPIEFLSKFLKHDHKLESLSLLHDFGMGLLPKDILSNLVKSSTLKTLHVNTTFSLSDECLTALTVNGNDSASVLRLRDLASGMGYHGVLTPSVLHKFLFSHRLSLRRLALERLTEQHLGALPLMENLAHLTLRRYQNEAPITSNLFFCTQMPNLIELDVDISFESTRLDSFVHFGLRSLSVQIKYNMAKDAKPISSEMILNYVDTISAWFPSLSKLVIRHPPHLWSVVLPVKPFRNLEQKRTPGESVWY